VSQCQISLLWSAERATTSLGSLLALHPQAGIVQGKEPHFFSYDEHYRMGLDHTSVILSIAVTRRPLETLHLLLPNSIPSLDDCRIKENIPIQKLFTWCGIRSGVWSPLCGTPLQPGSQAFASINDAVRRQR